MFKTAMGALASSGFERRPAEFAAAIGIVLASRRLRARFLEKSGDRGMSDARRSALYMLAESPDGLTQTELAERVGSGGPHNRPAC